MARFTNTQKVLVVLIVFIVVITAYAVIATNNHQNEKSTVTYDANGGSANGDALTYVREGTTVQACGFTNGSAVFLCWNTAADGSGTNYGVGSSVASGTKLYAQWGTTGINYIVSNSTALKVAGLLVNENVELKSGLPFSTPDSVLITLEGATSCELLNFGMAAMYVVHAGGHTYSLNVAAASPSTMASCATAANVKDNGSLVAFNTTGTVVISVSVTLSS